MESQLLCLGGRLTLIISVLANLSVYYLSLLRCPISLINQIEKLQRDFLWHGRNEEEKFHLFDWSSVRRPKEEGGLGIRPLRPMMPGYGNSPMVPVQSWYDTHTGRGYRKIQ